MRVIGPQCQLGTICRPEGDAAARKPFAWFSASGLSGLTSAPTKDAWGNRVRSLARLPPLGAGVY
jgi:hypothetical protein